MRRALARRAPCRPAGGRGGRGPGHAGSLVGAIGSTPLIEVPSLSKAAGEGCRILAKCEHLNPGGSVKDRAAKWIVEAAESEGLLRPGDTIVEGTGGNTGIGLAIVAAAKGYKAIFTMPESIALEKQRAMRALGAEVVLAPPVPFSDPRHYFHEAARIGSRPGHFFTNQFENTANSQAHYESTAPELWDQTGGELHGFICAPGTGGTISGVAEWLKHQGSQTECWIIDPPGSGLFPLMREGPGYAQPGLSPSSPSGATRYASDRTVRYVARSPGDNRAFEGIGIDRITANFARAYDAGLVRGAFLGGNLEPVELAHLLMRTEGLNVGPSAALNLIGAVWLARRLGPGSTVATVICDSGERYSSKLLDHSWLETQKLVPQGRALEDILRPPGADAVAELRHR